MTKIRTESIREYFTSVLYPFVTDEIMAASMTPITTPAVYSIPTESMSMSGLVLESANLQSIVQTYNNPLALEELSVNNISITSASLVDSQNIVVYNNGLTEELAINNISITAATLEVAAIIAVYNNGLVEEITANNIQIISGTLQ